MEMFVFLAAVNDMARVECIPLYSASDGEVGKVAAESEVLSLFHTFSVQNCLCHSSDTRDKLLSIIEAGVGTLEDFDVLIRNFEMPFKATPGSKAPPKSASGSPSGRLSALRNSVFFRTFSVDSPASRQMLSGPGDTLDFAAQVKDPTAFPSEVPSAKLEEEPEDPLCFDPTAFPSEVPSAKPEEEPEDLLCLRV
jgi:hypothetical protein